LNASPGPLEATVIRIVAGVLDRDPATITRASSLIDDLGAESIDFLDLVFSIESEFGIKIPENELWQGRIGADPSDLPREIAALRARMPEFRWDRFPRPVTAADLPRLITVQTIVDYLKDRDVRPPEGAA
jgi:acyl carrier protein